MSDDSTGAVRASHYRPGSAAKSEAPHANFVLAVGLFVFLMFAVPVMPVETNVWALVTVVTWAACMVGFLAVGLVTAKASRNPENSLADLMPLRMVSVIIGVVAVLPVCLIIPL